MTRHMVINRGDLQEVLVSQCGKVHVTFSSYCFATPDQADAAYAEMVTQHPGWPVERKDVSADQEVGFDD